jgi:hypothetical protein
MLCMPAAAAAAAAAAAVQLLLHQLALVWSTLQ